MKLLLIPTFAIPNFETGEVDYIVSDSSTFCKLEFDEETGEPTDEKYKVRYCKSRSFQIPKEYLKIAANNENNQQKSKISAKTKSSWHRYEREDYINMDGVNSEIILGYSKANYRMFLIPTLFCFNMYSAILVVFVEIFLHIWSHHKNRLNANTEVYFRSPLHVLTSQFCAQCRLESDTDIFTQLNRQMRNAKLAVNLKEMTKAIS